MITHLRDSRHPVPVCNPANSRAGNYSTPDTTADPSKVTCKRCLAIIAKRKGKV